MSHRFKIGQRVRLSRAANATGKSGFGDVGEVVRLMPADQNGEISYRIRSGIAERAVREDEIVPVS